MTKVVGSSKTFLREERFIRHFSVTPPMAGVVRISSHLLPRHTQMHAMLVVVVVVLVIVVGVVSVVGVPCRARRAL